MNYTHRKRNCSHHFDINNMQDFDELKKIKAQCLRDITEALPDYVNRLNSIDTRLLPYVEDAISNEGSHSNLYENLGIRKELRLMVA